MKEAQFLESMKSPESTRISPRISRTYDITLVSTADWDYPFWTNKQHVATSLVNLGCRVLYIDSLGLRSPRLDKSDLSRIAKRFLRALRGPRLIRENLWVCSPILIPAAHNRLIIKLNEWILRLQIYNCRLRLKFHKHILWTYNPALLDYIDKPKAQYEQLVYHCVDNISAQPCIDSYYLEKKEKQLCLQADAIFVTSQALYDKTISFNENSFFYPNVADVTHFSQARSPSFAHPPLEIQGLMGRPIIGFVGAISAYKINFRLISKLAQSRPGYHFLFIGKIGEGDHLTDVSCLSGFSNIHFIGPKPYDELPLYLHFTDIALLPCLINDYTTHMFPMKFFEYVAAGVPIVSTNLPSLHEVSHYAHLCVDEDEFLTTIDKILDFPKGVGLRAPIPLKALPPWCGYDERTELMLQDLERLASHAIQ